MRINQQALMTIASFAKLAYLAKVNPMPAIRAITSGRVQWDDPTADFNLCWDPQVGEVWIRSKKQGDTPQEWGVGPVWLAVAWSGNRPAANGSTLFGLTVRG